MNKYDLGIIGGMGSEATVEIYKRIIDRTVHSSDQEHMKICILNYSIIPDRTNYILNNGEDPKPYLSNCIKDLENIGVNYFIVPCNTAHYFEDLFKSSKCNFISMIEETFDYLNSNYKNKSICILGTTGTINSKVYHNHIKANNCKFVYANDLEQSSIMNIINNTKADYDKTMLEQELLTIVTNLKSRYPDCVFVTACTELSLYSYAISKIATLVDAMDCLVNSTIIKCGYNLKEK